MEKIIQVEGLKKSYGEVQAVKGIDFYVERGSLFAFLGPNGAGKTTTIEIICTLIRPDAGSVRINGHELLKDDNAIREQIGIVFQDSLLDRLLTVRENLYTRGSFYGMKGWELRAAVEKAAEAAEAQAFIDRPYGNLSGGQRRRADIARALVNTPKILFLDEPTTGLDPQTRKSVWDTVRNLQEQTGMTVFLTTHYMEEAAKADYVCVIDGGGISAKGTPAELMERYSTDHLIIRTDQADAVVAVLKEAKVPYILEDKKVSVTLLRTTDAIPLLKACEKHISVFEVTCGSMDDAFIAVTGKEIRE